MPNLCEFSLIIPGWLGPVVIGLGFLLGAIGFAFLAKGARVVISGGKIILKLFGIELSLGFVGFIIVLGIVLVLLGIAAIAAVQHQPFGRWIGGLSGTLVDKKDPAVAAEINGETMGSIESNLGQNGLYVVQLTAAAKKEIIKGDYVNQRCYAELVNQICRQESQRLNCRIDTDRKVIKVCKLPADADCAGK